MVSRLWLEGFVEEERMVPLAKPRAAVVQVPEGDTVYLVAILLEGLEQTLILLSMKGLHRVAQGRTFLAELQLATHLSVDSHIEFCDVNVLYLFWRGLG